MTILNVVLTNFAQFIICFGVSLLVFGSMADTSYLDINDKEDRFVILFYSGLLILFGISGAILWK